MKKNHDHLWYYCHVIQTLYIGLKSKSEDTYLLILIKQYHWQIDNAGYSQVKGPVTAVVFVEQSRFSLLCTSTCETDLHS